MSEDRHLSTRTIRWGLRGAYVGVIVMVTIAAGLERGVLLTVLSILADLYIACVDILSR